VSRLFVVERLGVGCCSHRLGGSSQPLQIFTAPISTASKAIQGNATAMTLKEFERAVFGRIHRCRDGHIILTDWDWDKASAWHVWKMGYRYRQNSIFRTRQR
jgi:hypothetical protein